MSSITGIPSPEHTYLPRFFLGFNSGNSGDDDSFPNISENPNKYLAYTSEAVRCLIAGFL